MAHRQGLRPRTTIRGAASSNGASGLSIARVTEGRYFSVSHFFATVNAANHGYILLRVGPAFTANLALRMSSEATVVTYIHEAPTLTGDGTPLTVVNVNRDSTIAAQALAFHTPSVSAEGTLLFASLQAAGQNLTIGGPLGGTVPLFVFNKGTDYLVEVDNIAGGDAEVSLNIGWYEEI